MTLEAKGEIPEDLQESIEVAINRTILDLANWFKFCFGPECAGVLAPEEVLRRENSLHPQEEREADAVRFPLYRG